MFDLIADIFSALSKNKLRTFLTGFAVAWGIFMLMILLGCSNGLKKATQLNFTGQSQNCVMMWMGRTTLPYKGFQSGRRPIMDKRILDRMCEKLPQIDLVSPRRSVWGVNETYKDEYISQGGLYGITEDYTVINDLHIIAGRSINGLDHSEGRKVVVMHKNNVEVLFKGANPLGEYIVINQVPYKVVGIYSDKNHDQNPADLIPLSTLEKVYPSSDGYGSLAITVKGLKNQKESEEFDEKIRATLAESLQFDPRDKSAVYIWNASKDYYEAMGIFNGLSLFMWLIGIGTLIAGVVGIGNIMLVTVKERTKEFGIRKSLGAKPSDIIKLILTESLMITGAFGYFGLLFGVLVLDGLCKVFPEPDPLATGSEKMTMFVTPSVDLGIAIAAMMVLVVAGLLAAYIPAKRAIEVKPIEAMHYEA